MPNSLWHLVTPGKSRPRHALLSLLALTTLFSGCAGMQKDGAYHYLFERHYEFTISHDYAYLGNIQTTSDSITLIGGVSHPINRCRGYVVQDVYYIESGENMDELVVIYRDNTACTWMNAYSELEDGFLTLCANSDSKYVTKINELASASGKKLSGCYRGMSKYGYFGKKTLHIVYLFLSEDKIKATGKDPREALLERMRSAVTLLQ